MNIHHFHHQFISFETRVLRLYMCREAHDQPLMVVHPLQGGVEDHGRSYKALHSSDRWPCKVIPYSSPRSSLLTQANQFLLELHHLTFFTFTSRRGIRKTCIPLPLLSTFLRTYNAFQCVRTLYRVTFVEIPRNFRRKNSLSVSPSSNNSSNV